MKPLPLAIVLLSLCSSAVAQGSDSCATPTALVGPGPWSFDNTSATTSTEGQTEALCLQYGSTVIKKDVWFTWNATFSGMAVVTTCGLTTVDTKLGVYPGTACPTVGTALGCNDDGCFVALESQTNAFPVVTGQDYVVQIGVYPVGTVAGGIGTFDIQNVVVPANDSCATPLHIATAGQTPFDTAYASRDVAFGQNETTCLLTTGVVPTYRDLWFTYTAQSNSIRVFTCDLIGANSPFTDTRIAVYPAGGCPTSNTSIACGDDGVACVLQPLTTDISIPTVCGNTYLIQLGNFNPQAITQGLLEVAETGTACSTPSTSFCAGDSVGTTCLGCGNNGGAGRGCANSSFAGGALLGSSGFASIGSDTLILTCSDLTGPGLFFQANGLAASPIAFGDGMLCASVGIIRMGVVFPTAGSASYPGGLTPSPIHIAGGPVSAGDVKHYQCWYRDALVFCTSATFNTSNGVTLTWGP